MKHLLPIFNLFLLLLPVGLFGQPQYFSTSLHATRQGKITFYSAENGGFEALTSIPIEDIGCLKCHASAKADGSPIDPATYTPDCSDCHITPGDTPSELVCLGCHGREKTARMKLQLPDVHRDELNMSCVDCHSSGDVHGDGTAYASMLQPGAIDADCENCHQDIPQNPEHQQHRENIHCSTCHTQTVIACYNCHFNSMADAHIKRAYKPIHGFMLIGVRSKDQKIHPVGFQSLYFRTPDGRDTTFYTIGPVYVHNVVRQGRTCSDCHANENVQAYNATGELVLARWNAAENRLFTIQGVAPVPEDWQTAFKLDFLNYTGRLDTAFTDPSQWVYVETGPDAAQNPGYVIPLNATQMQHLSTVVQIPKKELPTIPEEIVLHQNFPNPFNNRTRIDFELPRAETITLKIYSPLGQDVFTVIDHQRFPAGIHSVFFESRNLPSGVYLYGLSTPTHRFIRKMVLLK